MLDFLNIVPGVTGWEFLGLTVLTFFTSAFGVVAGLGGGVMLLAVMTTIFPPATLIPLHGAVQFGANVTRIWLMWRDALWTVAPIFAAGAILGAFIGGQVVVALPKALLQGILGVFLLYVCWAPKFTVAAPSKGRFFILGVAGTLITMFVGATGTLLAPFFRGATKDRIEFVATSAVLMTFVHGLKVVVFGVLGFAFGAYLPLMVAMIAMTFFGNYFGRALLSRMPEQLFTRIFQVVLTILAVRLIYAGLVDAGYI